MPTEGAIVHRVPFLFRKSRVLAPGRVLRACKRGCEHPLYLPSRVQLVFWRDPFRDPGSNKLVRGAPLKTPRQLLGSQVCSQIHKAGQYSSKTLHRNVELAGYRQDMPRRVLTAAVKAVLRFVPKPEARGSPGTVPATHRLASTVLLQSTDMDRH